MEAAAILSSEIGIKPACEALEVSRASFYRTQTDKALEPHKCPSPPRALSSEEQQGMLDILHSERFVDKAPYEVYATLLDEGQYHCSIRTMYRILDDNKEVKERRNQLSHPVYQKPELLVVLKMPEVFVRFFPHGITKSTGIPESACLRRKLCITGLQKISMSPGARSCAPPMTYTQNVSLKKFRYRHQYRRLHGSISRC
jgi:hypothetical protein